MRYAVLIEWDKNLNRKWLLPQGKQYSSHKTIICKIKYNLGQCPAFHGVAHPENPTELSIEGKHRILLRINPQPCTAHIMPHRPTLELDNSLRISWRISQELVCHNWTKDSRGPRGPSQVALSAEHSQDALLFLVLKWKIKAHHCLSTLKNIMLEYAFSCTRWFRTENTCSTHFD